MEEFHKTMKRSSTLVTIREGNETNRKLPQLFYRYPTRFSIDTFSDKNSLVTPIYVPAPKPSKLLLEFLKSPSSQGLNDRKNLSKINELAYRKTKSGFLQLGSKTPNLAQCKNTFKTHGEGIGRRIKIIC